MKLLQRDHKAELNSGASTIKRTRPDSIAPNHPPNANAGLDKKVNEGSTVNLDARRSSDPDNGNKITYSWKQLAGRPLLDLGLSADGSGASFNAPSVDRDTILTYAVTVTDEKGAQGRDTVKVLIKNVNTVSGPNKIGTIKSNNAIGNTTSNALTNAQISLRNNNVNNNNTLRTPTAHRQLLLRRIVSCQRRPYSPHKQYRLESWHYNQTIS